MTDIKLLPLPEPYGYLRDLDGRLQMSIGPVRPADRAGGYATPWAAMYDPERVRANVAHATAAKDAEIEALRAERDVIGAEAVKYADKSGRLEAKVDRLAEALRELRDLMLGQVKWMPCDCGCPQQRTPDGPHSVTWLRAAQQVEIAIGKSRGVAE